MEKEMSSYILKIIDQLVKLYMDKKIDLITLQDNLETKLQFLEYVICTGKADSLQNEISETISKCSVYMNCSRTTGY